MGRCSFASVRTPLAALAALLASPAAAQGNPSRFDVFSIFGTTGGYYLRTVSSKGDQISATCQLVRKGGWDFSVEVYPAAAIAVKTGSLATLNLSGRWAYPLHYRGGSGFVWATRDTAAFALFLKRVNGMGWGQNFVSRELNVDFQSHGSNDPTTIAAFAHLCRLPGLMPNAY